MRRHRVVITGLVVAALASLALTACGGSFGSRLDDVAGPVPARPASVPLDGLDQADLHIAGGFATISLASGAIGDDLVQARTTPPAGTTWSSAAAVITVVGGTVTVTAAGGSDEDGRSLQVIVNPQVSWRVSLDGGTGAAMIDFRDARLRGIDITQGVASLDVTLPEAVDTDHLAIVAGASTVAVHVAGGAPVRATMTSGAGSVTIDGVARTGIAAGTTFMADGWDTATDRVDIACTAGVGTLVVDRT